MSVSIQMKKSVDDIWPVAGKRVLIRVDFNGERLSKDVLNDYHIRSAIPTIHRIIDQGGICVLMSHLGRPAGVESDGQDADLSQKRALALFQDSRGKTSFFSTLSDADKMLILSWSSKRDKLDDVGVNTSKTGEFSRLTDSEKKVLLVRFMTEHKERFFPQLSAACADERYSLQAVAVRLAELLGQHVYFAHDCLYAKQEVMRLRCGEVMLLENLRFYADEVSHDESKRMKMAAVLASYADVFVNDAFGSSHRQSASITGVPRLLGHGVAGYQMERELSFFSRMMDNPPRPMIAIVGGAKVSDKILLLENLLKGIDKLIIGGGMAFSFLKARGYEVGQSVCEDEFTQRAQEIIRAAHERKVELILPLDHICHTSASATERPLVTKGVDIPSGYMALDIGPKTIQAYSAEIRSSKSVLWNGPLGMVEVPCYTKGSYAIARVMSDATKDDGLLSVVAGGDSANVVEKCGAASRISHVSTGGVAALELLEGHVLPGVSALDDKE